MKSTVRLDIVLFRSFRRACSVSVVTHGETETHRSRAACPRNTATGSSSTG